MGHDIVLELAHILLVKRVCGLLEKQLDVGVLDQIIQEHRKLLHSDVQLPELHDHRNLGVLGPVAKKEV